MNTITIVLVSIVIALIIVLATSAIWFLRKEKKKYSQTENKQGLQEILQTEIKDINSKVHDVMTQMQSNKTDLSNNISNAQSAIGAINKDLNNLKQANDTNIQKTSAVAGNMETRLKKMDEIYEKFFNLKTAKNLGEIQLNSMVRQVFGAKGEGVTFATQTKVGATNKIADVIIYGDNKKNNLIVDSKLNANIYNDYQSAKSEFERKEAIKKITKVMLEQIKSITKYYEAPETKTVALYIPIEKIFYEVVNETIIKEAQKNKIMLASPTTLWFIINDLQKYQSLIKDLQDHDQIGPKIEKVRKSLEKLYKACDDSDKELEKVTNKQKNLNEEIRKSINSLQRNQIPTTLETENKDIEQ